MHQRCDDAEKKIGGITDFISGGVTATLRIPPCKCCVLSWVPHLRKTRTTKYVSRGRDQDGEDSRTLYPTGKT